jgi:hypothetical protein
VDPAGQALPALQVPEHAAATCAVAEPYRPAGQLVHTAAPASEYCPAGHTATVALVDRGPQAYPALHASGPLQKAVDRPVDEPNVPPGQGAEHASVVKPVLAP